MSQVHRQFKKYFGIFHFSKLRPPIDERISNFEHLLKKCEFSRNDSDEITKAYFSFISELLVAQYYYQAHLAKDRMEGRLIDRITEIQYHLEQMALSGIMDVSKSDYDTAIKVLHKLRDADFERARVLAKFTRKKQFSNRAIHLVHKKVIDLLRKNRNLKSAFDKARELHNALLPDAMVEYSTIRVEYFKIQKSLKDAAVGASRK